jgi:hypothetical protein
MMLLFSGLGSMLADRMQARPYRAMVVAGAIVVGWVLLMTVGLDRLVLATLDQTLVVKLFLLMLVVAPLSLALGMPFPLGLGRVGETGYLPWAWGLNGAFSVVATPLANLMAREFGFSRILFCAAILYVLAILAFPSKRKTQAWLPRRAHSPAVP